MTEYQNTLNYIINKTQVEIVKIKSYLASNRIILIPLAQKMGGKTYYLQFLIEALGQEYFATISAGDLIRDIKKKLQNPIEKNAYILKLKTQFLAGVDNKDEAVSQIAHSDSSTLVPDEIIFTLLENEIRQTPLNKSFILDGIPRTIRQISYIKRLEEHIKCPIFLFYFDTSYEVLDIRANSRRICPVCKTDYNLISMPTRNLIMEGNEVVMLCDKCQNTKLIKKSGDEGKDQILKARQKYEDLIYHIKETLKEELVIIKTCIPCNDYNGPKEEVNKAFTYQNKNGQVTAQSLLQKVATQAGHVYPLSPEFIVTFMLKEIASSL
ncbi:MAG: nucleoside monophosphate kinase [Patescibacteria group bacterium]